MVEVSDLTQLYASKCMLAYTGQCVIKEPAPNAKVTQVSFNSESGIVFCDKILSESKDVYQTISYCLAFQKNCDGLIMTELNGQKYFIWVELKSGYNEVAKQAVLQIASSYLKHKSALMNFSEIDFNEYREFGIIVSNYPAEHGDEDEEFADGEDKEEENRVRRLELRVAEDPTLKKYENLKQLEQNYIAPLYRSKFRHGKNDFVIMKGSDFGYQHLQNIRPELKLNTMPIVHLSTNETAPTFDLESIINQVSEFMKSRKEGLFV